MKTYKLPSIAYEVDAYSDYLSFYKRRDSKEPVNIKLPKYLAEYIENQRKFYFKKGEESVLQSIKTILKI